MTRSSYAIIDSTLREGEQTPGVTFNDSHKHTILKHLAAIGIDEIELGIASPRNSRLPQLTQAARKITGGSSTLALWSRCVPEDIAFAGACMPDVLSLSIPASDAHIYKRLQKNRQTILELTAKSITAALNTGIPFIALGLEDSSRADPDFLLELAKTAEKYGASRVRLADTVGVCTPATISRSIKKMQQHLSIDIGVHCHNDFGMATGNSMAALEAGALWVDATVLGLGERAGNCKLEEICGALAVLFGEAKYAVKTLPDLCQYVANATQRNIPVNHPLAGSAIFTCETGLHQHGLAISSNTYEPYNPKLIGRKRTFMFGKKSGKRALTIQLERMGIKLDEIQLGTLLQTVRSSPTPLNEQQLMDLTIKHHAHS